MLASAHKASIELLLVPGQLQAHPRPCLPQLHLPLSRLPVLYLAPSLLQSLWAAPSPQPSCISLLPGLGFSIQSVVVSPSISVPQVTAAIPSCSMSHSCECSGVHLLMTKQVGHETRPGLGPGDPSKAKLSTVWAAQEKLYL